MKYKKGNMKKAINKIDNASGITLVALVITVILLLILAAVTINLVLGDNGLIKTAKDVSKNYVNAANNEDEQISEFINTMNNIISGGTGEEGIGAQNKVIIGEVVWNENTHTASVTISKSAGTESGIQMQYQINNETGVWTTVGTQSITISDLKHNDVVYARLLKGSGVVNRAKKNIRDTIPPEVGITITNIGSNSMTASVTAQDKQYGMPNTPTYTFEIKETGEADSQYTQRQTVTTTTCSFTGLKKETNYTVRVTTSDKAGNSKSVTATKSTNAVEIATGNISFGSTLWNKTTHTASINITTETELQIQYKTSGSPTEETGWSTPGTSPVTVPNLTHNQTIYARLWDGNNAGDYASYTIKDNIDPQDAQISSWETTDITVATSATVKLLLIDNESGVNVGNSKWTLHTSSDPLGTSASDYDNTFTGTSTEPEITISKQETGTYYLHVLTVDNAGRTKETVFTEKAIIVTEDDNSIAADLKNPSNYGRSVNYSVAVDDEILDDWKLFYIDKDTNDIFIIYGDYLPTKIIPESSGLVYRSSYPYKINWLIPGSGNSPVAPGLQSGWSTNSSLFKATKYTLRTSYENSKCVSTLLNTANWTSLVDSNYVDLAIGSPTIEMWVESWQEKGYGIINSIETSTYGYGLNGITTTGPGVSTSEGYYDKLFFPYRDETKASGYWLASPHIYSQRYVMIVSSKGAVSSNGWDMNYYAIRPVIHIRTDKNLQWNSNTSKYDIVNK